MFSQVGGVLPQYDAVYERYGGWRSGAQLGETPVEEHLLLQTKLGRWLGL